MPRTEGPHPPTVQIHPRIPRFVNDKLNQLVKDVRLHGFIRLNPEDVIGALVDAATSDSTARALKGYTPKAGRAMVEQDEFDASGNDA